MNLMLRKNGPSSQAICKDASDKLHLDVNDMKRSNAASISGACNLVYSKLPAGKIPHSGGDWMVRHRA